MQIVYAWVNIYGQLEKILAKLDNLTKNVAKNTNSISGFSTNFAADYEIPLTNTNTKPSANLFLHTWYSFSRGFERMR